MAAVEACGGMAAPAAAWRDDATVELQPPYGGKERIFVPPWRIDGASPTFTKRAPLLGEHTAAVLEKEGWAGDPGDSFHFHNTTNAGTERAVITTPTPEESNV